MNTALQVKRTASLRFRLVLVLDMVLSHKEAFLPFV